MNWRLEADQLKIQKPRHILFLCVANSARSQIAEGIARSLAPKNVNISSAGSHPSTLNPLAIQVMSEIGIDIRMQTSKSIDSIDAKSVDAVITLCAEEVCPIFSSNVTKLHWGLNDPTDDLPSFRNIRDELKIRLEYLFY